MSKFMIVQVSKDEDFKMKIEDLSFVNTTVIQVPNNKEPLANVYNEHLKIARTEKDVDFVLFMHADVSVDITHLLKHIEECKDKYDVFGLCGCSKISTSQQPLNWFCGSRPFPEFRWGCVTHGELGNQTSFFSQHHPNEFDHEVACIDGLCIIFGPKALQSNIIFDTNFKFHHYDTDISFECILHKNLKLGVLVEKSLQHYSVGKGILEQSFLEEEIFFRKKWKIEL